MQMWFHVTDVDLGPSTILEPRIPISCGTEPEDIARICVAPSIHQCLSAIDYNYGQNYFVYCAYGIPRKPYGIKDAGITEEMWFTEKTEFKRLMVLSEEFLKLVWLGNDHQRGVWNERDLREYARIQIDREWLEYLMHGM